MYLSQEKLDELWEWAKKNRAELDGLERAPHVIIYEELEQRMSVPVKDGSDVVHYTRRSESDPWKEADL